eukprot:4738700-Heterocapsa_arctica.AAC.1
MHSLRRVKAHHPILPIHPSTPAAIGLSSSTSSKMVATVILQVLEVQVDRRLTFALAFGTLTCALRLAHGRSRSCLRGWLLHRAQRIHVLAAA